MNPESKVSWETLLFHDVEQDAVVDLVEGTAEINKNCCNVFLTRGTRSLDEGERMCKLIGGTATTAESRLTVSEDRIEVSFETSADNPFDDLAENRCERDRTIRFQLCCVFSGLEERDDALFFPTTRYFADPDGVIDQLDNSSARASWEMA